MSVISSGTFTVPFDTTLTSPMAVGSTAGPAGTISFSGDAAVTPADPSIASIVLVDAQVPGQTTAEQSRLTASGIFLNAGTIAADGPTGSTFTLDAQAGTLAGGTFASSGTLAVAAGNTMLVITEPNTGFFATGAVQVTAGGTFVANHAMLSGTVTNDGVIRASGTTVPYERAGTLEIAGTLLGAGTLAIGANGVLRLDNVPTEVIAFPTIGAGDLILLTPGTYAAPVLNLASGDNIEVAGGPVTSAVVNGSTLTIVNSAGTYALTDVSFAAWAAPAIYSNLDGGTGYNAVTIAAPVDNWTGALGTNLGTAGNWSSDALPTSGTALFFGGNGTLIGSAAGISAQFGGTGTYSLTGATLSLAGMPQAVWGPFALGIDQSVLLNGSTLTLGGGSAIGESGHGALALSGGSTGVDYWGDTVGGGQPGSSGALTLTGTGTSWTELAMPDAPASNGSYPGYLNIGIQSGASGTLTVEDFARLTTGAIAQVGGNGGSGLAEVQSGGSWTAQGIWVGNQGSGSLVVSGGSVSAGNFNVGMNGGFGQATIEAGGIVTAGTSALLGYSGGSSGALLIGPGGTLDLLNPTTTSSAAYTMDIGDSAGAQGAVTVSGAGALLNGGTDAIALGLNGGSGTLMISNGGTATMASLNYNNLVGLSVAKTGTGLVQVSGAGSDLMISGGAYFGRSGHATLTVSNGGLMSVTNDSNGTGWLGIGQGNGAAGSPIGGTGVASVTANGTLTTQSGLEVGVDGVSGTLDVNSGGLVEVGLQLVVGLGKPALAGSGVLNIGTGGTVQVDSSNLAGTLAAVAVGAGADATGTINVSGRGALLDDLDGDSLSFGTYSSSVANSPSGTGVLNVNNGGVVEGPTLSIGNTGTGTANVASGGSVAVNRLLLGGGQPTGTLVASGTGKLSIGVGGTVTVLGQGLSAAAVAAGYFGGATGSITVAGAGALLDVLGTNHIMLGGYNTSLPNSASGTGSMTISGGGAVLADGLLVGATGQGSVAVHNRGSVGLGGSLVVGGGGYNGTIAEAGTGSLAIGAGGTVSVSGTSLAAGAADVDAGTFAGATGNITVGGTGAVLNTGTDTISLGTSADATGNLVVLAGGFVQAGGVGIGDAGAGFLGVVAGTVSAMSIDVGAQAGAFGQMNVSGGGLISAGTLSIGDASQGAAAVFDGGSIDVTGALKVGGSSGAGIGILAIGGSGTVSVGGTALAAGSADVAVGTFAGMGNIMVGGAGAVLNPGTGMISLGTSAGATGNLVVLAGGLVQTGGIAVGDAGSGFVAVQAGSLSSGAIDLGAQAGAQGRMNVSGGGQVSAGTLGIGGAGQGAAAVFGGGGIDVAGALEVGGGGGTGTLAIGAGSTLTADGATSLGAVGAAKGGITVSGSGAVLNAGTSMAVGDAGTGAAYVGDLASLIVNGALVLGNQAGSNGSMALVAGARAQADAAIIGNAGSGRLTVVSGAALDVVQGLTVGATGGIYLQGGTLAAASVTNSAVIAGSGLIQAPSIVDNSNIKAAGGLLTIFGALSGNGLVGAVSGGTIEVQGVGSGNLVALFGDDEVLQVDDFAAFNPARLNGLNATDRILVVTNGAGPVENSISSSYDGVRSLLSITVGSSTKSFHLTGQSGSGLADVVAGTDTVTASGTTIALGGGMHFLHLGAGASNDTIVAPDASGAGAGFLDVFGATTLDTLDFSAALTAAGYTGDTATLGNFVQFSETGNGAAVISIVPSGGSAKAVMQLEGTAQLTPSTFEARAIL